jgi:hypothetical protein
MPQLLKGFNLFGPEPLPVSREEKLREKIFSINPEVEVISHWKGDGTHKILGAA